MMREFGKQTGAKVYDVGEGVCHQLIPEKGHVVPGDLMVGCDSHTCTYGALNVFSTGVGSTDGAAAMASGKLWFKVPETMKVTYNGALQPGRVQQGPHPATSPGRSAPTARPTRPSSSTARSSTTLSVEARMTISNMAIEVGAKAGLMNADDKTLAWFEGRGEKTPQPQTADADAVYAHELEFDASAIGPQIAKPHAVDNVVADRGGRGHADRRGLPRHVHERAARGPRDRREHPRRAARCTRTCASSSRRRRGRSCSTRSRPATSRRSSRPAPRS